MNNEFNYVNQSDLNSPQPQYVTYIPYGLTPQTFEERKRVKKIANIIGTALLIMSAVSDTIVILLRFVLSALGYFGTKEVSVISSPAFLQFLQGMLSITMFTLPFILLFKLNGFRVSSLIKFKKPKKEDFLPFFFLGVGVCYFANFAVSAAGQFFADFGIEYTVDTGENPDGFFGFMLTFITVAVIPPLVEEFACRGLILGSLRKFGDGFAVLASAILFGIMHGNFQQMPFAFLVGLVLGFITVKTNTIWIAIAVHAFNNGLSVILDYINTTMDETTYLLITATILTLCLLFFIVAILLFKDKDKVYKIKKPKINSTPKQVFKWFFIAPTIIVFIVICFIGSLKFFTQ